jgi:TrwC relaxase
VAATLHKLTAGDGYLYLIRQVAASDSTERGRNTLSEYYSAKGESPGRWVGTGLASLSSTGARDVTERALQEIWTVPVGSEVHEQQMAALFGEGLHPNAVDITNYTLGRGAQPAVAIESAQLGRRFAVRTGETEFQRALAAAYRDHNARLGQKWNAPISGTIVQTSVTMSAAAAAHSSQTLRIGASHCMSHGHVPQRIPQRVR